MAADADIIARTFAPLLLFQDTERHFPGMPETFRRESRFRQSNYQGSRDRGWNKRRGDWEDGNRHGSDYLGIEWKVIASAIAQETAGERPGGVTQTGPVTRPRDDRNMWRGSAVRGFFLELREGYGRDRSGVPAAPIFYDVDRFRTPDGADWVALSYWFFYIYNWHVFFAHEGDWEHITLYFDPAAFRADGGPEFVFYAAHNSGHLVAATNVEWCKRTHPTVFVSAFGHPSYPAVSARLRARYRFQQRTWEAPPLFVPDQAWSDYCGAWGEVGMSKHSTGPLGPWFKRGQDTVKLSVRSEHA